ncbi:hypothetical protein JYT17_00625, partial [Nitrospira defluvii]|nr:hypothetical protein [Nitrospira defluvii]
MKIGANRLTFFDQEHILPDLLASVIAFFFSKPGFQEHKMKPSVYSIKSAFFTLLLFFFLSIPQLSVAQGAAQEIEGSIDDLSRALMTYFPKVSGRVTALNAGQIEIDLETGQGLAPGLLLSAFRKGARFHHPVTSVPMGHFEGEAGHLEVLQFESPRLSAKSLDTIKKIEVGDLVRLPSTKITLGIAMGRETADTFLTNE